MSIATISKDFEFAASHQLEGLEVGHKCSRIHGHNYIARIEVTGNVVPPGFVVDYAEFSDIKRWLDESFDHQDLNSRVDFNPTAENLALHILQRVKAILLEKGHSNIREIAVHISETPKTWATSRQSLGESY